MEKYSLKVVLLSVFIFTGLVSFSQTAYPVDSISLNTIQDTNTTVIGQFSQLPQGKRTLAERSMPRLKMNTSLGTSVTSDLAGGVGVNTYINPNFQYDLAPKVKLHFGTEVNYMNLSNIGYNPSDGFRPYDSDVILSTLYIGGTYLVNEKLAVSGTLYKTFDMSGGSRSSIQTEQMHPAALNFSAYGGSVNIHYKVSDQVTIDANIDINSSKGNSLFYPGIGPYPNSPFNPGRAIYSPFGNYRPYFP